MNKKISRLIAIIMSGVSVIFVSYAVTHPEASFSWNNTITYID